MQKGLEALDRILNYWVLYNEDKDEWRQIKDILPKSSQIIEKELKVINIIKECFDLNGFDELIPNSKWYESKEKQKLLKEVILCQNNGYQRNHNTVNT